MPILYVHVRKKKLKPSLDCGKHSRFLCFFCENENELIPIKFPYNSYVPKRASVTQIYSSWYRRYCCYNERAFSCCYNETVAAESWLVWHQYNCWWSVRLETGAKARGTQVKCDHTPRTWPVRQLRWVFVWCFWYCMHSMLSVTLMHGAVQARLRPLRDPVTSEVCRSCYSQVPCSPWTFNLFVEKENTYQYLIFWKSTRGILSIIRVWEYTAPGRGNK